MTVEITEPALTELNEAVDHYNLQSHGLGNDFFDDVYKTISLIQEFPDAWSKCSKRTRKAILRKYPYNLIYHTIKEKIYIIAISHQHREPDYWIERL